MPPIQETEEEQRVSLAFQTDGSPKVLVHAASESHITMVDENDELESPDKFKRQFPLSPK